MVILVKLLQSGVDREAELNGVLNDIDHMSFEDVKINQDGYIPSISFSKRVQDKLVKPWQNSVVVKLLGR